MADVYADLGEPSRAEELRAQAAALKEHSNKRQIKTIASNMGHCLWTGIAAPDVWTG